jgi:4-carboxymuconolactone decarboxylase
MDNWDRSRRAMNIAKRYRGAVSARIDKIDVDELLSPHYGPIGELFPDLLRMTEDYLLGDVMSRPGLTLRERSMIIITTLTAVRLEEGLKNHMNWALNVGISREEVVDIIVQIAPYGSWPAGVEVLRLIEDAYPGFLNEVKETRVRESASGSRLTEREKGMIVMAALIAHRFNERLKAHMRDTLQMGISRETLLEIIMQVTPFVGWPVGCQAISVARQVFILEGKEEGSKSLKGKERPKLIPSELRKRGENVIQRLCGDEDRDELLSLIGEVSPDFLNIITAEHLFGEVWSRPSLNLRDRALITLAVLIAFRYKNELKAHVRYALNVGVSQEEIMEIIMHTANYTCWGAGVGAAHTAREVFLSRKEKIEKPKN